MNDAKKIAARLLATARIPVGLAKKPAKKPAAPKCPVCGFKIRGVNHEASEHHQRALRT